MRGPLRAAPGLPGLRLLQGTPGPDRHRRRLIGSARGSCLPRLFIYANRSGCHGWRPRLRGRHRRRQTRARGSNRHIATIHLVGNEAEIQRALAMSSDCTTAGVAVVHASEVLTMDDKPVEGIRRKKDSSIVRAVELVRDGKADAVISPGNTGAPGGRLHEAAPAGGRGTPGHRHAHALAHERFRPAGCRRQPGMRTDSTSPSSP